MEVDGCHIKNCLATALERHSHSGHIGPNPECIHRIKKKKKFGFPIQLAGGRWQREEILFYSASQGAAKEETRDKPFSTEVLGGR